MRAANLKLAILSNGTPCMLDAAVRHSGLAHQFDFVLSAEEAGIFKPHPTVYRLALDRLQMQAGEICSVSANGWDAYSAKAFGMKVLWCNRAGQVPEHIPEMPDGEIRTLDELSSMFDC